MANAAMWDKSKYGSNLASFHGWLSLYIFWRRTLTDITLPQYFRAHQHPAEISRDAPAEPRVQRSKLSTDYMETDRGSRAHSPHSASCPGKSKYHPTASDGGKKKKKEKKKTT